MKHFLCCAGQLVRQDVDDTLEKSVAVSAQQKTVQCGKKTNWRWVGGGEREARTSLVGSAIQCQGTHDRHSVQEGGLQPQDFLAHRLFKRLDKQSSWGGIPLSMHASACNSIVWRPCRI